MRCITIQQPWAWAIFHGKVIENRTQVWSYRGPLAIHSGQRFSQRGANDERVIAAWTAAQQKGGRKALTAEGEHGLQATDFTDGEYGVILGVADLVDAHPDAGCCRPWGESSYVEHGGKNRRHISHLVLEKPRELITPIPCRGALGLWVPPADIAARIEAAATRWDRGSLNSPIPRPNGTPSQGRDLSPRGA